MTASLFRLDLEPPFLIVRFEKPQRILGWSITKPGFSFAKEVVWLEVHDDDLAIHIDPVDFVSAKLQSRGFTDAAAFMTSREIRRHHVVRSRIGRVAVTCLTTVGLSNGERVGKRRRQDAAVVGTVNTLVHISRPLSDGAFVEAVSIATQARTAAIIETNDLRDEPAITGTGTDCILIAAPDGDAPETCAGLHTDLGEAVGAAVYEATYAGAAEWSAELEINKRQSLQRAT